MRPPTVAQHGGNHTQAHLGRVGEGACAVRLRLTSVSGFPRLWRNIRRPYAQVRLPPRQTGRADFPHPACPETFVEGVHVPPVWPCDAIRSYPQTWGQGPLVGATLHVERPPMPSDAIPAGALGSTDITRRPRYYDPLRLLPKHDGGYVFPTPLASPRFRVGRHPGRSLRFLDESVSTRRPLPPRRAGSLHLLVPWRSVLASPPLEGWPLSPLSRGRTGFTLAHYG